MKLLEELCLFLLSDTREEYSDFDLYDFSLKKKIAEIAKLGNN